MTPAQHSSLISDDDGAAVPWLTSSVRPEFHEIALGVSWQLFSSQPKDCSSTLNLFHEFEKTFPTDNKSFVDKPEMSATIVLAILDVSQ